MAKFFRAVLLFTTFFAFYQPFSAQTISKIEPEATIFCDAPAPDSFRITDIGTDWVSLAWEPVWLGATHRIIIALQVDSTVYTPIDTLPNVPGDSITLTDFAPGQYRISIATNCKEGGTGPEENSVNPPFGVILELVMNGRTPLNVSTMEPCTPLSYSQYNWIGFRIKKEPNGDFLNYFEAGTGIGQYDQDVIEVKRTFEFSSVVASTNEEYPHNPAPLRLEASNTFQISLAKNGSLAPIGYVRVNYNWTNHTFTICKVRISEWDPAFSFAVLTAQSSQNLIGLSDDRVEQRKDYNIENMLKVCNPFNNEIKIYPNLDIAPGAPLHISISDIWGHQFFVYNENCFAQPISIDTSNFPAGYYIITACAEHWKISTKSIKINNN